MKPEEIKLSDWGRIFAGPVPPEFYIELLIRTIVVYLLLMVSMRLLGKRMSTQVSRIELVALVSLAAAIGVPMLSADRGLLPSVIIAIIIVGFTRLISLMSSKSQRFEKISQGDLAILVEDSVMNTRTMRISQITRERLFAQLRSFELLHLGHVKRLYIEANGSFSIVKETNPRPGLLILPQADEAFIAEALSTTDEHVCKNCGNKGAAAEDCNNCGENDWVQAVRNKP
jgi:uncharacterized membrane protein YcaP (DUF421 family)